MTQVNDTWQPHPDRGWGVSFAAERANTLWAVIDQLNSALQGPHQAEIIQAVAPDVPPGLFGTVVGWIHEDLSMALGKPRPEPHTYPMSEDEIAEHGPHLRDNAKAQLADIDAQLDALGRMDEILVAIRSAQSRDEAASRLQAAPFGYTDWQAFYILDMTIASQTAAGVDRYRERRNETAENLRRLIEKVGPGESD